MIHIEEKLTLITPCFCAGADPKVAELRAPSIRGQLRWWFRVLGGTPEKEKEVFGGVHEGAKASKIVVRVKDESPLQGKTEDLPRQNAPLYYLFHFANAEWLYSRESFLLNVDQYGCYKFFYRGFI